MPETDNLRFGFKLAVNRRFYCPARYNSVFMLVIDAKGTQKSQIAVNNLGSV